MFSAVLAVLALVVVSSPAAAGTPSSPFDVVVSLEASPQGVTARQRYEAILQDFADAVFEASEGVHQIGTVLVYRGSSAHDQADVIWQRRGHPKASLNSRAGAGHIYMVDTFTDGGPGGSDLELLDPEVVPDEAAGMVLAHEWAHYAYGLLDEHVVQPGDVAVAPSLMSSPWNAASNADWRSFSIAGPGPGPFQIRSETEQFRAYGRSAWELLVDAPDLADLLVAPVPGVSERLFYSDLVAPAALPLLQGAAPPITVIWEEPCSSYVIALDNSASMTGQGLVAAKAVANTLVDRMAAETTWLSLVSFSADDVPRTGPPAIVCDGGACNEPDELDREVFHDAIDALAAASGAAGITSFAAGLAGALPFFETCSAQRNTRALFFISDGTNGPDGFEPEVAAYASAGIPIYVLDVSPFDDDETSNQMTPMVAGTGGILFGPAASTGQAVSAFREADAPLRSNHLLESGSFVIPETGTPQPFAFTVDASLEEVAVCASTSGPVASLSLRSPSNVTFSPLAARPTEAIPGDDCSFFWALSGLPEPGIWQVRGVADPDAEEDVEVFVDARGRSTRSAFALRAWIANPGGTTITAPEPVIVKASLGRELPITGARLTASLDGGTPAPLRDDGVAPDAVAGDGIYTGALTYAADGTHEVVVTAGNPLSIAGLSSAGLVRAPNFAGLAIPREEDVSIAGPLFRIAELDVTTEGMATQPTFLDDLTPISGSIAGAGEVDVFTVDLAAVDAAAGSPGDLEIRVTGALLGMAPRLRVYDGDPELPGTTRIGEATAPSGRSGVTLPVPASAGTVFVEVLHAAGGTGTYQLSAGPVLELDFGSAGLSGSPCDLALAGKNAALDALRRDGLLAVVAASVLVEESRSLERAMIVGIRDLSNAPKSVGKAGKRLKQAASRDTKALKRLAEAIQRDKTKILKGAKRKIRNARRKLQLACSGLPDGGALLVP